MNKNQVNKTIKNVTDATTVGFGMLDASNVKKDVNKIKDAKKRIKEIKKEINDEIDKKDKDYNADKVDALTKELKKLKLSMAMYTVKTIFNGDGAVKGGKIINKKIGNAVKKESVDDTVLRIYESHLNGYITTEERDKYLSIIEMAK